jgi:putative endonuclease
MFFLELVAALVHKLRPARASQRGRSLTRTTGDQAEAFALEFLKRKCGFRLLEQGMADEDGELDLVGRVKGVEGLVVVEVRARREGGVRTPRDAVDVRKQRQVVQTAFRLLRRRGFHDVLRFDVVGVYLDDSGRPVRAEHFADAFRADILRGTRRG